MAIFDMLRLEEALMRTREENFCLINQGAQPAIVLGISGKAQELVDLEAAQAASVPLIRRFSGGGTVYIDEETLFVSLICQSGDIDIEPYPKAILNWSEGLYRSLFERKDFALRENDFVFGEKKIGGNAEYLSRRRALLHTSFLWDYCEKRMELLHLPQKRPHYRKDRPHNAFLGRLKEHLPSKSALHSRLYDCLAARFHLEKLPLNEALKFKKAPHRTATTLITEHPAPIK